MNATREKLAASLVERTTAEEALAKADAAVTGARGFVAGIVAEIRQFAAVDARIASERADVVKAALSKGKTPNFDLSPELSEALAARGDAENRLVAGRSALGELEREATEARGRLAARSSEVSALVEAVVVEEAANRATDLERLEAEALRLRCELQGIAGGKRLVDGRPVFFRLGEQISAVLRESERTEIGTRNTPAWNAAQVSYGRWGAFIEALERDALATL